MPDSKSSAVASSHSSISNTGSSSMILDGRSLENSLTSFILVDTNSKDPILIINAGKEKINNKIDIKIIDSVLNQIAPIGYGNSSTP